MAVAIGRFTETLVIELIRLIFSSYGGQQQGASVTPNFKSPVPGYGVVSIELFLKMSDLAILCCFSRNCSRRSSLFIF